MTNDQPQQGNKGESRPAGQWLDLANLGAVAQNLIQIGESIHLHGIQKKQALVIASNAMNKALNRCLEDGQQSQIEWAAACLNLLGYAPSALSKIEPQLLAQVVLRQTKPQYIFTVAFGVAQQGDPISRTVFDESFIKLSKRIQRDTIAYGRQWGFTDTSNRLASLSEASRPAAAHQSEPRTLKPA